MAQQTTDDRTDTETVTVAVHYTRGPYAADVDGPEPGTEAFKIARDLRSFGTDAFFEFEHTPQNAVETGTVQVSEAELGFDADASPVDVAREVRDRMQGPRLDTALDYEGERMRSMSVGDVVVVDGIPLMMDRVGWEYVDVDLEGDC